MSMYAESQNIKEKFHTRHFHQVWEEICRLGAIKAFLVENKFARIKEKEKTTLGDLTSGGTVTPDRTHHRTAVRRQLRHVL